MTLALEPDVRGKVCVITGASRGIGRTIAHMLAERGVQLVLTARSTEEHPGRLPGTLEQTATECRERGAAVAVVPSDVAKEADVLEIERVTRETYGRCDVLINNAAISAIGPIESLPFRLWQRTFDVNVHGPYLLTRAMLPLLRQAAPSHVINVSSSAATFAWIDHAAYSASKAALDRLSITTAAELEKDRITVTSLQLEKSVVTEGFVFNSPGIDTSNWEQPEIMGEAVLWLVGHGARYTGKVVQIGELRRDYAAAVPG